MIKKVLSWLYVPYKFLVFAPILAITTTVLGTLSLLLVHITTPKMASLICGKTWARINSYLTPIWVKVIGRENIDKKQSYVIVSNHQSHYDIFLLYGWLGVDFKWVMKMELRKVPILGSSCEKLGHIYIDRSHSKNAVTSLENAKRKIVNGTSVVFFPEGTRSQSGEIGQFKKGAFVMALNLGVPVLPVSIINTKNILPSKTIRLLPGRAKMVIHQPIPVNGYDSSNIQELISRTREVIQRGVEEHAF